MRLGRSLMFFVAIANLHCGQDAPSNYRLPRATLVINGGAASYDFGHKAVGSVTDVPFSVQNIGAVAATGIDGTFYSLGLLYKGGHFPGAGGDCGNRLEPGGGCTIVVEFAPTQVTTVQETLRIGYDDNQGARQETFFPTVLGSAQ